MQAERVAREAGVTDADERDARVTGRAAQCERAERATRGRSAPCSERGGTR